MLRSYRDQAVVLRTHKLGEADRIVTLLGRQTGQIRAVAKGVRRTTSKFGSRLEAFNLIDAQFHRGRTLDTVVQVEMLTGYSAPLGTDYESFTAAKVMGEAVQKLTDSVAEVDPGYFPLLHGALGALVRRRYPVSLLTSSFLMRLMKVGGWEPILDECGSCGRPGPHALFGGDVGGLVCADCAPIGVVELSVPGQELLRALLVGDWATAEQSPTYCWDQVALVAGSWTQWHLEQRLRSLPFLTVDR